MYVNLQVPVAGGVLSASKVAVYVASACTFVSVRLAEVPPSLHLTNLYPALGLAVTCVPLFPFWTVCVAVPSILPPVPAIYLRV